MVERLATSMRKSVRLPKFNDKMKQKGLFVTVDGPNGVGKSTIVHHVATELARLGFNTIETQEPTKSDLGLLARRLESKYHGHTYACLIAADRYYHLVKEVNPALSDNRIVISARYVESSLVLQRFDNVDLEFIWGINSKINVPDLSVILTAPPEILEQRLAQRDSLSRFESSMNRQKELDYYLEAAEFLAERGFNILTLDNSTDLSENVISIVKSIQDLAPIHGSKAK